MKNKFIAVLLTALFVFNGCNEDILDIKNQGAYDEATYFVSGPQFNEAVVATYSCLLMQGLYSRDAYFIFDLVGNDASNNIFLLGDLAQLQDYSFGSAQPQMQQVWQNFFRMVLRANLVLDKIQTWEPTLEADKNLKKQYIGEAHFLRGYAYFNLVNLYGRVPLKLDYKTNIEDAPRAAVADVWKAVEADLQAAINALPATYSDADLGRATKGTAVATLGKAYLYQKKYPEAQAQLEALTKAPYTYQLDADYDNLFSSNNGKSKEVIFNVVHNKWEGWGTGNAFYMFGGQEWWGGKATHSGRAQEYGWNDWNNVFVSDALVRAFKYKNESGADYIDPRAKLTFYGDAASGGDTDYCNKCEGGAKPYPFGSTNTIRYNWRKYCVYETKAKSDIPQSDINTLLIRFADVKLMLAESLIFQNKMAEALPHINDVRKRVGAFEYTALGAQSNAVSILQRERQMEFGGEMTRWFDLVRWGIAQQTLNSEKQAQLGKQPFQTKHALFPIPKLERDSNPLVNTDVQNDWN